MKKCLLFFFLVNICNSNSYSKNLVTSKFVSQKNLSELEIKIDKEIKNLPQKLFNMVQKIKDPKEKATVIKLYQNINSGKFKNSNKKTETVSLKILEVIKNLTSPIAIASTALVTIMALVYKTITSQELIRILEEMSSLYKWKLVVEILSYAKWIAEVFAYLKFLKISY
ncbi:hypothetical protein KAT08_00380 [Candidatus Babeliales bacterium]|nr:hypothetical protein [Candidatus Babeliales bacterium]